MEAQKYRIVHEQIFCQSRDEEFIRASIVNAILLFVGVDADARAILQKCVVVTTILAEAHSWL